MTYTGPTDFPVIAVGDVHDGDTYWLTLDLGLRTHREINVRLDGFDCPEIDGPSKNEQQKAREARDLANGWLRQEVLMGKLRVVTGKDPLTWNRWVGDVYTRLPSGSPFRLGDILTVERLAVPWHKAGDKKWHEVYDLGVTTSPPTGG